MLIEGQVYYCPICGAEIRVIKGAKEIAPLTCCGVDMLLKKTSKTIA